MKASSSSENLLDNPVKKDLPKVNISKRRELFEKENSPQETNNNVVNRLSGDFSKSKSIKERLSSLEQKKDETNSVNKKMNRLSGDVSGIKERFTILNTKTDLEKTTKVEVPITSLKDRLTSLHSAVSAASEEVKKPIILVDLNALAAEEQNRLDNVEALRINQMLLRPELEIDTDREDSGIQTADVSCAVSQADEQPEEDQEIIQLENVFEKLNKEIVIIPDVVPFVEEVMEVKTFVIVEALQVAEEEEDDDEDNVFSPELTEQDTSVSLSISENTQTMVYSIGDGASYLSMVEDRNSIVELELDETSLAKISCNSIISSLSPSRISENNFKSYENLQPVEEELCKKIDASSLPKHQLPTPCITVEKQKNLLESPSKSKKQNIFDFIKTNLLDEKNEIKNDNRNSTFYISLDSYQNENENKFKSCLENKNKNPEDATAAINDVAGCNAGGSDDSIENDKSVTACYNFKLFNRIEKTNSLDSNCSETYRILDEEFHKLDDEKCSD